MRRLSFPDRSLDVFSFSFVEHDCWVWLAISVPFFPGSLSFEPLNSNLALKHSGDRSSIDHEAEPFFPRDISIMEKVRNSKAGRLVDKLAVESEPGLTNAQLLLTNFDLKPGAYSDL